jgi:hypothetical protein
MRVPVGDPCCVAKGRPDSSQPVGQLADLQEKGRSFMELAGLEPATSWVRSTRFSEWEPAKLQRFSLERLECRNISRNSLQRVLHFDNT